MTTANAPRPATREARPKVAEWIARQAAAPVDRFTYLLGIAAVVVTGAVGTCQTNARFDDMNNRFDDVHDRIDNVDGKIETLAEEQARIRERLTGIETRLDHVDTRLDRIETHLNIPPAN